MGTRISASCGHAPEPGGHGHSCLARFLEQRHQSVAIVLVHHVAHLGERVDELVELVDDGRAVLGADVGPNAGMAGRHARHVAEATGREPQQHPLFGRTFVGQLHQRGRRQVRNVRHQRNHRVVPFRRERYHLGAERRDDRSDGRQALVVGGLDRSEHPRGAFEQVGPGTVHALELGARHGVATHVPWIAHQLEHRRLHAADVGHQTVCLVQCPPHLVGHHADGSRDEGDLGIGVIADRVERTELTGSFGRRRVGVTPRDMPALLAQAESDRAADQPGADDEGAPRRTVSHGGTTASARQIVIQTDRTLEVHVVQVVAGPLGVDVHE